MSKLDAQNAELREILRAYYESGDLNPAFMGHLERIRRYTSGLPNFKGYSGTYKQDMETKARDRAVDALLKKKFDITKANPVSFFGNLYYNTYLNAIRDKKCEQRKVEKVEGSVTEPERPKEEAAPIDPVSLFAPFVAWIQGDAEKRFPVFCSIHYPELFADKVISKSALEDYLATFPGTKQPKGRGLNIAQLMADVCKLRKKCNTHNDMSNEGLRNNLVGLRNIIDKRLKIKG